jgi:hypothetical protein
VGDDQELPLSNSGKMMVVIMNTDKDAVSVHIVGFQASGIHSKGDLYRRPFGIFDNGDHLSFVFVSSPTTSEANDISDVKGPGANFMEIFSI